MEKALPIVKMLPGERHRERALTVEEEELDFAAAKSEKMQHHFDPSLLHDVASILLDCGLRPEECFRLRPENVRDGRIEIQYGKTDNARRRIPMTPRVAAILEMWLAKSGGSEWVFPAATKSGHIEPSSLKKQHLNAIAEATRILRKQTGRVDANFEGFEFYTLRHTCLTRWAPHMDPLDAGIPGWTPRCEHHKAVPPSAGANDTSRDGLSASGEQWAYFWAY